MAMPQLGGLVGTARCAVRAALNGARVGVVARTARVSFRPLNAGGDIAARCPHHGLVPDTFNHTPVSRVSRFGSVPRRELNRKQIAALFYLFWEFKYAVNFELFSASAP